MDWYYSAGDQRVGPVSTDEFRSRVNDGTVQSDTLVWRQGMRDWAPFGTTGGIDALGVSEGASSGAGQVQCVECGRMFAASDVIDFRGNSVCATCKPIFFQKFKEGITVGADMHFAGFWIRFVAVLIDSVILFIVNSLLQLLFTLAGAGLSQGSSGAADDVPAGFIVVFLVFMFVSIAINFGYQTYPVAKYGGTPGKLVLGLKIVRPTGENITMLRAFARIFAQMLSGIIFYIGYIMAAFDDEKRALHDRICDTRVIKTR